MSEKIHGVVGSLISSGAWRAVKYLTPKQVVRATRHFYGKRTNKRAIEITLTIGPPNYREREVVKTFRKAGELFPVRKIQLQFKRD